MRCIRPKITRIDIAHDFLDGSYSPDQAVVDFDNGLFSRTNRVPKSECYGTDWRSHDNTGKTFYVGSRKSSKYVRVYEKGKQLGDKQSVWTRFEIEFKARDCVIPIEVLLSPSEYLAGAYPVCQKIFADIEKVSLIEIRKKKFDLTESKMIEWLKKQIGTSITSAPYTDVATGQAQQTKMTVNRDGSIEIEYIPRPDLTPDSSQAPTRTEIPEPTTSTTTAPTTKPIKEGSSTEAPDVCAQNPNSVMCLDAGPVDYEDPILPTHQVNVSFEPSNIFNTDGVCPKPYRFSIGRFYEGEISFQAACDAAYKIRPMFILCAMFISAFMVYGAIKEMK